MTSLAFTPPKPKKGEGVCCPSPPGGDQKEQFPELRLNGAQAEMAGLNKCAIGDEYEITLRIKAKRLGGDSYEMSEDGKPAAIFDVLAADAPSEVESEAEDSAEPDEEEGPVKRQKGIQSPREAGLKGGYGK